MGATSMSTGSFLMTPPGTIFTYYPIYTDDLAAVADWFKKSWKESRKPRVAYLTADNAMGKSIETPEMEAYLKNAGYEFVGTQYVPLVPTSPPTTQLMWLKQNKVDLALGIMVNPGAQPTVKEMVRLGMGPNQPYKIVFACGTPGHIVPFVDAMGELGDGFVVSGDYPSLGRLCAGYKVDGRAPEEVPSGQIRTPHPVYGRHDRGHDAARGPEARTAATPLEKLKPVDVLNNGFYKIKNLDMGGITARPSPMARARSKAWTSCASTRWRRARSSTAALFPAATCIHTNLRLISRVRGSDRSPFS